MSGVVPAQRRHEKKLVFFGCRIFDDEYLEKSLQNFRIFLSSVDSLKSGLFCSYRDFEGTPYPHILSSTGISGQKPESLQK